MGKAAAVLAFLVILTGCGGGSEDASTTSTSTSAAETTTTISAEDKLRSEFATEMACNSAHLLVAYDDYNGQWDPDAVATMINELGDAPESELNDLGEELAAAPSEAGQRAVNTKVIRWCNSSGYSLDEITE
jgi:isocitrate dehydrogenase